MADPDQTALFKTVRQSPPVDLSIPYDIAWVKGKTILITGGASGIGEGFAKLWAANGATIIIGDIAVEKGDQLARQIRSETGNTNVHFVYCDVTDWQSQVNLFKQAVKLSLHGGIDTVVANAGISIADILLKPINLDAAEPPKPDFRITEINLIGTLYTTHLALFYLPRNPGSSAASPTSDPASPRDRHLLLLGSIASLGPLPVLPQYAASKHGVIGLFRSLRFTSFTQGIRVNLLCPYFIRTTLIPPAIQMLLAGSGIGDTEDVVEAGSRLVSDSRIVGRALAVGPMVKVKQSDDGSWENIVPENSPEGEKRAVFEVYADDHELSEAWIKRFVILLNTVERVRGWIGWLRDIAGVLWHLRRSR